MIEIKSNHQLGEFFYKFAEQSGDIFWVRDADFTTFIYISPAFEKIWKTPVAAVLANSSAWEANIHPDDINLVKRKYSDLLVHVALIPGCSQEYRMISKDGKQHRIEETCFAIFDENQKIVGFTGVTRDMSQAKTHLAELEEASQFFRFFAEKVPAAFWARDDSCNKQLYLSPGYEKIWERDRSTLYANPNSWLETLHPEDRDNVSNFMRLKTLEEVGPEAKYEYRYRIFTPENKIRWVKDTSFPIHNEKNEFIGFAGIAEDITKEVLREQELWQAKLRAEAANQAKSDFLAMISHELRTPLNAILGMAEIIKAKGLVPESRDYVDIISNAGNSLLTLVSDVLDFVRLEAGKLSFLNEPFDLKNLINDTVKSLKYQALDKHIELKLHFTEGVPAHVKGDAGRIRQVLINLIVNAIKFTEEGRVEVNVCCVKKDHGQVWIETTVKDTGIGIDTSQLERIFDRFTQVDSIYQRKHGGIGLGLAITKELVKAMGGNIEAHSTLGEGSIFKFSLLLECATLPIKLEVQEETDYQKMPRRLYNLKILLIEDNLINQKIARIMFEDLGCKVEVLNNGQMALDCIDSLSQYDFIFMDVGLPDMSGFDITRRLRQEPSLQTIPIIALTAHILERDQEQAFASGMNEIIAKPINYEKLQTVLESYLEKQQTVNAPVT